MAVSAANLQPNLPCRLQLPTTPVCWPPPSLWRFDRKVPCHCGHFRDVGIALSPPPKAYRIPRARCPARAFDGSRSTAHSSGHPQGAGAFAGGKSLSAHSRALRAARRRRPRPAAARAGPRSPALRLIFLLDTNILAAVMASPPAAEVATWMAQHPLDVLFTATVCQAEILSGIAILPKGPHGSSPWAEGPRREALEIAALAMFREDFAGPSCRSIRTPLLSTRRFSRTAGTPAGRRRRLI